MATGFPVAEQNHVGAGDLGAGGVGHHAADGRGLAQRCECGKQNDSENGEVQARRDADEMSAQTMRKQA